MKVGDYIIKPDGTCECTIWRVSGIYLGGVGQESVIGLVSINKKPHSVPGEMFVPLELVEEFLCEVRHDR